MDDREMSLLKENGLGLIENEEEAEDLEEQIKRREELQNLLINVLDDFKFEDSTINSSTNISIASGDHNGLEETYRNAETSNEQLKILYDIRTKEIKAIREEFETYKVNSEDEINGLRRRLTLQEAETSQIEITLNNTKSLLVEKMDLIAELEKQIALKNEEIGQLHANVEKLQFDIQGFDATIKELQLQITMNTGPFSVNTRNSTSEELKNRHKEQIAKLETIIQELQRKVENLEEERNRLKEDLNRNIDNSNKNEMLHNSTINLLSANVESSQNQCKDLLNLVEMLSKENEHYRNRIQKLESHEPILLSESFKRKSLDYDTLLVCNERLKKMLLDKDVEVSTLKSKTKFYENDIKELLDYRNMRNESLVKNECNHPEHSQKINMIQSELKKLRRELVEKKHEIIDLTTTKKELEERIENMIIQTRNDIENLSNKYKLPELETMNEELKNAEIKISDLQEKLMKYEREVSELKFTLKNKENQDRELNEKFNKDKLINEIEQLKQELKEVKLSAQDKENKCEELSEKINNEEMNKVKLKNEINQLKQELEQVQLSAQGKEVNKDDYDLLKKEFDRLVQSLKKLDKIEECKNRFEELFNVKGEKCENDKCSLNDKIKSWIDYFDLNCVVMMKLKESESSLSKEVEDLKNYCRETEQQIEKLTEIIEEFRDNEKKLEDEKQILEKKLDVVESDMKTKTEELIRLKDQIEICKSNEINFQETIKKFERDLQNEKMNKEKREVEVELKEDGAKFVPEKDHLLQAKVLEVEVSIRDKLHKEYERKIYKIEETYKNICEMKQRKLNDYEEQEIKYRHQLADMLNKYAQLILPIEKENNELREHVRRIEKLYGDLKNSVEINNREYLLIIEKSEKEAQKKIDAWKIWAKKFVQGCLNIEKVNAQSRNSVLNSIKNYDSQIKSLNEYFEKKIEKHKSTTQNDLI